MTSIAWDGTTLAADGQVTCGNTILGTKTKKIHKLKGKFRGETLLAFASSGDAVGSEYIKKWLESGGDVDDWPEGFKISLIVVTDKNVYITTDEIRWLCLSERKVESIGSGQDFVFSALELGLDAVAAVKHACKMDIYSSGTITKIKLR